MPTGLCLTGTLTPYVPTSLNPWDQHKARHLFRRMGFGASLDTLNSALQSAPADVVDQLIDETIAKPLSPEPVEWGSWTIFDYDGPNGRDFDLIYQHYFEWGYDLMIEMAGGGLREKLMLFWSNHFVTEFEGHQTPPGLLQYHKLLQTYALGNFKEFVHAIGITPAMLIYLNGEYSTKESPNENYARELYELFTLGHDNGYTQPDIIETSRALTGWYNDDTVIGKFDAIRHDHDAKTIFGRTGNWGYDDVIEILFEEKGELIASYICEKLYRLFVYETVNEDVVSQLATVFQQNNWELAPVIRLLLKSEHFFDEEAIGIQIKSPLQLIFQQVNELEVPYEYYGSEYFWGATNLGQQLFSPIDVAGWQGHHKWISTSRLSDRWKMMEYVHYLSVENHVSFLKNWVKSISPSNTDPEIITQSVIEALFPKGLEDPAAYNRAAIVFRGEIPSNYFDNGSWNLDWPQANWQLFHLLNHLARLPEFQLS